MAKPRVFISSTYYDLKHIRSSLDLFIESLGFDSVLSEKGNVTYAPDIALDESCYRELAGCDLFVLIIGGRFGSAASDEKDKPVCNFFDTYDSITKKEYDHAVDRNIPSYILIEGSVYSKYQTYLRNKERTDLLYAHVDSVNVFRLIEDILAKPKNNPIHTFERAPEIQVWLKEQWSGLFRELLLRMNNQQQLAALSSQVQELKETNNTLRKYLEAVMIEAPRGDKEKLIKSEAERLIKIQQMEKVKDNGLYKYINSCMQEIIPINLFIEEITKAESFNNFAKAIADQLSSPILEERIIELFNQSPRARKDLNDMRRLFSFKALRSNKIPQGEQEVRDDSIE